jgi:hypothetical protein
MMKSLFIFITLVIMTQSDIACAGASPVAVNVQTGSFSIESSVIETGCLFLQQFPKGEYRCLNS